MTYGTSSLRPGVAARPQRRLQAPRLDRRCRAALTARPPGCPSSGRRPCRPGPTGSRSTVLPASAARSADTQASAWAGSSAGMMPSVRREQLEGVEHLGVGDRLVAGPADVVRGGRARGRRPGSRGPAEIDWASCTWPHSSCSRNDSEPCTTPGTPWPIAAPPAGSTPTSSASVSAKPAKMPAAFDRRRRRRRRRRDRRRRAAAAHCSRASSPMTRWNSRTIHGYGCGPITEPRQ